MIWVSVILMVVGVLGLVLKRDYLGIVSGLYVFLLGAVTSIVISSMESGYLNNSHPMTLFITLVGAIQILIILGFALRLYYLSTKVDITKLRKLRG